MCLAIPARLVEINGDRGKVEMGGATLDVSIALLKDVKIGDYLIIHAGYALDKLNEEEARKTLDLFDELAKGGYFSA